MRSRGTKSTGTRCWLSTAWKSLLHLCAAVTVAVRKWSTVPILFCQPRHPAPFPWSATKLADFLEAA